MYQGYKLGIVVPAYNESMLISETLNGMPDIADRIYIVDDGSTDDTRAIVENYNGGRFYLLSNGHNSGVGAAIAHGYRKALEDGMDIVTVMAGDNQMDARYLPALLSPVINDSADYAKGNRLAGNGYSRTMSKWRLFGNWILTMLTKIASGYWGIRDPQNGYTAISNRALRLIDWNSLYPRYGYCNDLLVKLNVAGCRVVDVPIPARYANEKSDIKYGYFIRTVSPLLLRGFLLRLRMRFKSS